MIEINNLSKSYGINKIFENESITLTNSCIYALVGVNGIGKSTFLNSIIQPSTLDKGSVKIDDIPSTDFTAKYHYAFVPDTKDMFLNLTGKEYLQFVLEQLSELQEITYRAMMGEFIIYYRGKIVGGIYDDRLLVKPTKSAISYMPTVTYEIPYENAKEMLLVEEVDNKDFLTGLFDVMYDELPTPKPKKKK